MINILATPSDSYAMPCGVMFYSACVNNPKGSLHFYVLTDTDFTENSKEKLRKTIMPYENLIDFIIVDDVVLQQTMSVECSYYPRYVFYRLFAFKFLPADLHTILYLDCDIIIRNDLHDLWDTDMSMFGIAGVPDTTEGSVVHYNDLEYPSTEGYINAGVILINLDYWRENKVEDKIVDAITNKRNKLRFHDQDVLNLVFHNSKKHLHIKYNVQSGFYYTPRFYSFEYLKYKDELEEGKCNPVILHLCGPQPWSKGCSHPLKKEFFKYQSQTLWMNSPLWRNRRSLSKRFIDFLRKPLSRFGVSVIEDPYDRNINLCEK